MMHDFAVTQKHVLFPVLPLTGSIERAMCGKPLFAWEADKRSHVGIMERQAATPSLRWFDSDACHSFHFMNAWDDGDKVVAYVMQSDVAPGLPNADGQAGDPAKHALTSTAARASCTACRRVMLCRNRYSCRADQPRAMAGCWR